MQEKPITQTEPVERKALPEQILWLAVIERAMMDYIAPTRDCQTSHVIGLDWFFDELEAKPFNLQYICDNFLGFPDTASKIRKRVRTLAAQNDISQINRSRRYKGYY